MNVILPAPPLQSNPLIKLNLLSCHIQALMLMVSQIKSLK
ncbi:hypothetical protein V2J09_004418 [Rumex salicifolius]